MKPQEFAAASKPKERRAEEDSSYGDDKFGISAIMMGKLDLVISVLLALCRNKSKLVFFLFVISLPGPFPAKHQPCPVHKAKHRQVVL